MTDTVQLKLPKVFYDPSVVECMLMELAKIPDKVLELSAGNFTPEELMVQAIGEALVIVGTYGTITCQEDDLIPPPDHEGPDIQLIRVPYTVEVNNLAQQYWDHVSN